VTTGPGLDSAVVSNITPTNRTKPQHPGEPLLSSGVDEFTTTVIGSNVSEWSVIWRKLKTAGWTYKKPTGLSSWKYVRPGKSVKNGRLGEDYFEDTQAVIAWVNQKDTSVIRSKSFLTAMIEDEAVITPMTVVPTLAQTTVVPTLAQTTVVPTLAPKTVRASVAASAVSHLPMNQSISQMSIVSPNISVLYSASASAASASASASAATASSATGATIGVAISEALKRLNPSVSVDFPQKYRVNEYEEISRFLRSSVDSAGGNGSLYVSGGPGTGKTITVKRAAEDAVSYSTRLKDKSLRCSTVYLSMSSGADSILNAIGDAVNDSTAYNANAASAYNANAASAYNANAAVDHTFGSIATKLMKNKASNRLVHYVILILDEIDLFVSRKGTAADNLLHTLFRWSSNPEMSITLIGISNVINPSSRLFPRLGQDGEGTRPITCVFDRYDVSRLSDIITDRVGPHFFKRDALELISRKCAVSGDCRMTLDLARECVEKAATEISRDVISSPYITGDSYRNTSVVTIGHVSKALPTNQLSLTIRSLPSVQQMVLCVAVTLIRGQAGSERAISIGELLDRCKAASREGLMDNLNATDLHDMLLNIESNGLVSFSKNADGTIHGEGRNRIIEFGCHIDDVNDAIDATLAGEAFYASLMRRTAERQRL
jgi:Cdc6-like AAA superfamily ATPase